VPAPMPGVDLRLDAAETLLRDHLAAYIAEYRPPEHAPGTANGYHRDNPMYGQWDAEVLYGMVRHFKPPRVLEIGAGYSTLVIEDAADRNRTAGHPLAHRVYDPFPAPVLHHVPDVAVTALGAQAIPDDEFARLHAGDLLFIDTTHTVKPGGDVVRLLLELLPTVAEGVIVHIHDFFRPFEYPRWLMDLFGIYWQEHYLLQALLAGNPRFEVLMANHAMIRLRREAVLETVPTITQDHPGSALWLRCRA
jgi:hypothetical protein